MKVSIRVSEGKRFAAPLLIAVPSSCVAAYASHISLLEIPTQNFTAQSIRLFASSCTVAVLSLVILRSLNDAVSTEECLLFV
jgi:hypothetical protein